MNLVFWLCPKYLVHIISFYCTLIIIFQANSKFLDFFKILKSSQYLHLKCSVNHEIRENLYSKLGSILRNISNRHIVIIAGDFNAKSGSAAKSKIYQAVIGKYCEGQVNTNGAHLLNFSCINNLKLVNTFFKHKLTNITTWTSPETPTGSRRNSYRNQIDYILVRKHKGIRITNVHPYGGMMTPSDHKLLMMSCKMK